MEDKHNDDQIEQTEKIIEKTLEDEPKNDKNKTE